MLKCFCRACFRAVSTGGGGFLFLRLSRAHRLYWRYIFQYAARSAFARAVTEACVGAATQLCGRPAAANAMDVARAGGGIWTRSKYTNRGRLGDVTGTCVGVTSFCSIISDSSSHMLGPRASNKTRRQFVDVVSVDATVDGAEFQFSTPP